MTQMSDPPRLDSSALATLRELIAAHPALQALGGGLVQYAVVIDANIVIADLLHKHKNQATKTAIEETITATVLKVHAPRWLDEEITTSAIPQVAQDKSISEEQLQTLWLEYKEQIIWDERFTDAEDFEGESPNPKDMPYVALQEAVAAVGILTRDRGMSEIGGKVLTLDFVFSAQAYARAATYSVGIRVSGTLIGWISVAALVEAAKGMVALAVRLPPWAKVSLLIGLLVIVLHPTLRGKVVDSFRDAAVSVGVVWPELQKLMLLAQQKQEEAAQARETAETLLQA